ncbi:MAG: hypothetical protein A3F12_01055 [Gammaproteobacteria bacterium RIFCSPHIGHO2_12_FULL_38_14]|nr:MAG: hypothetical protein A3F12_01055 [Gammaproteobacteria bacterium RIFCSPHIGHO2_12_FULL_38_14]
MRKVFTVISVALFSYTTLVHAVTNPTTTNPSESRHKKVKHTHQGKQTNNEETLQLPKEEVEVKKEPANKPFHWLDGMSTTFAFTSDYVFRGISQTQDLPAAQGGFTYTFPFGLYLNLWGSNVKFTDSTATVEIDSIIGWHGDVGENFTYDVNAARYSYPRATELAYNELNSVFNYRFLQAGVSYSANVYNAHTTGTYYSGGINYDIPPQYIFNLQGMNILALMGHYSLGKAAGNSYNDYNIALSKQLNSIYTFMLQWTNTNGRAQNPPYDNRHIIATLTANV